MIEDSLATETSEKQAAIREASNYGRKPTFTLREMFQPKTRNQTTSHKNHRKQSENDFQRH